MINYKYYFLVCKERTVSISFDKKLVSIPLQSIKIVRKIVQFD